MGLPLLANGASDLGVLEGDEEVGEDLDRAPEGVIVNEGEDLASGVLDALDNLSALVGMVNNVQVDAVISLGNDGLDQVVDTFGVTFDGDDDDLLGLVGKPKTKTIGESVGRVNGRNDDADISTQVGRILGKGERLVLPGQRLGTSLIVGVPKPGVGETQISF